MSNVSEAIAKRPNCGTDFSGQPHLLRSKRLFWHALKGPEEAVLLSLMTPMKKLGWLVVGASGAWLGSVLVFFVQLLLALSERGHRSPELSFAFGIFVVLLRGSFSAAIIASLLGILIFALNDRGFFEPWPRTTVRAYSTVLAMVPGPAALMVRAWLS